MINKKIYEIYYARTFISLIILIALIEKQKKNKNKRILYISKSNNIEYKNRVNKKTILFFKNFLKKYFDKICFVQYDRKLKANKRR